jgi:hypothetical protein
MVSKAMEQSIFHHVRQQDGGVKLNPKTTAQAVVNAAWTDYDQDDNDTFPKTGYYLVHIRNSINIAWFYDLKDGPVWELSESGRVIEDVIRYATPSNLMHKEIE